MAQLSPASGRTRGSSSPGSPPTLESAGSLTLCGHSLPMELKTLAVTGKETWKRLDPAVPLLASVPDAFHGSGPTAPILQLCC